MPPTHSERGWRRQRLGPSFLVGVQRRQVRVGRQAEPVAVIRLIEDVKAGEELILTRRDVRFAAIGLDYELRRSG